MPLPIGFFMPLPLPIMIPFMMWQSAAIAAGFGTYFQFAKRRVSAMSNEDFNKADPHELVNSMYEDIVKQIPSSFAKVDSLTPVMLQSMNVMLDQAVKWLQGAITGNFFGTPNPELPSGDLPDTDVTPTVELFDPTFSTVKNWASTKLNLVHANQMHLYTSKAQGFIHSVHDFNKKDDKTTPLPETDVPGPPISDFTKDFQWNPNGYTPLAPSTVVQANNFIKGGQVNKALLFLQSIRSNMLSQQKNRPAKFSFYERRIQAINRMFLDFNKLIPAKV